MSECLHIAQVFERAGEFDVIHNSFDFLPLTYSGARRHADADDDPRLLVAARSCRCTSATTRAPRYVAISDADRHPSLDYVATIHHGIDTDGFALELAVGAYLLFFGRIHPDKGTVEAIDVAEQLGLPLVIAGIVQDQRLLRGAGRAADRRRAGALHRSGRAGRARRGARRRPRAAAPDRVRRAVRVQRRRGDGLRHARDRVPPGLDAGADRRTA